MVGNLIIEGRDAYGSFGVFVADGGYGALAAFNALKEPDKNDWPEENGIEVDLSDPKFDNKTFGIRFCGDRELGLENFIDLLDQTPCLTFEFVPIGLTRRLRLTGMPGRCTIRPLGTFELQFACDDPPFEDYARQDPVRLANCWQTGYEIDARPLSDYGVWVTDGIEDALLTSPSVKANLLVKTDGMDGALYDGQADVVFGTRDAQIRCHIRADVETFWRNRDALFWDLTRPGLRNFFYGPRNQDYPFYYKSCAVDTFTLVGGEIWCDFTITICLTELRVGDIFHVLGSERREVIVTEDHAAYIDVNGVIDND